MKALRPGASACALALIVALYCVAADFTNDCATICDCKWKSGNKAANCSARRLEAIPDKLSNDIQNFDLSSNPLYEISQRAFENVGLRNLKKLYLHDCKLSEIHKEGFGGLSIMIELDLSRNNIQVLHPNTFNETIKLRHLTINQNKLQKIEDGLFNNLVFLQMIDLKDNQIFKIGVNSFLNLPALKTISLENNNLTHVKLDTFDKLPKISSLGLLGNPWKCDCNLQLFKNWVMHQKVYTHPTTCAEPENLRNRLWSELSSEHFACKPKILEPTQGTTIKVTGENITLSCKVVGNPTPEVNWEQNSRTLNGDQRKSHTPQKYITKRTTHGTSPQWTNLTIIRVEYKDKGDYTCVAKNPAGADEKSITLTISKTPGVTGGNYGGDSFVNLLIWLTVAVVVILLILVVSFCIYCRRRDNKRPIKSDMHSSNGEALIEGSVVPEMQKSLITTVNPLTKPPRRYDMPSSVTSGTTEMSEMSKVLLDNDSVFAPNEDESRSMDFVDQKPKRTRETFAVDSPRADSRAQYPPDLLSFPPRGGQTSPAASSASTAPDSSRLPPQVQAQSPLHSPIYGQNPNLFRSLPYSRSQSPFPSPVCPPVVLPRQGYVTIPRRPRVPSWSSTSTAPPPLPPGVEYVEPVYDNLGLRTTADGSSALSLNKAGLEQQLSPIMRGRPLPATPSSYQGPFPSLYTNSEELERAPSPAPSTHYERLPRVNGNSMHLQLSPNAEPQEPRRKKQPETGSLKRFTPIDDNNRHPSTPTGNGRLSDSNDTLGRSGKIPPRPPPKPKKKSPSDSNGPLFEDEGEDGTEV